MTRRGRSRHRGGDRNRRSQARRARALIGELLPALPRSQGERAMAFIDRGWLQLGADGRIAAGPTLPPEDES